jgi:tetratricopeptide (TPR) repeat protein
MKKYIPLACLMIVCCAAGKATAQRMLGMPDSVAMRKEWLKTIERTTQDMAISYNHKSMAAILVDRADAEAHLKRYSKAIDDYNKAIFFDPTLRLVYDRRARVYEVMGNYRAAIGDREKALAELKGDKLNAAVAWNYIAGDEFALGNYSKAAKADSTAIMLWPQFAMAYANKGWANLQLGKFQQAADDFTESMKGFQGSILELAAVYKNRADAYRNLGKYTEAISDYNSTLQYAPDAKICYWGLAVCYGFTNQHLLAENNFAKSAALYKGDNQNLSKIYVEWAALEDVRHDYAKEIADDSLAVAYDNKNADAYNARAHAYALNGQMQKSIDSFSELTKFYQADKASMVELYGAIVEQEYFLGQYDKAIETSNAAITLDPHALLFYLVKGRAYLKKASNDMAAASFNQILAADTSKHTSAYAFALFFTGKQDQALGILKAGVEQSPNDVASAYHYYYLARMCALMNKPDDANAWLRKSFDSGYSRKYALCDPDFDNLHSTQGFKDMIAEK